MSIKVSRYEFYYITVSVVWLFQICFLIYSNWRDPDGKQISTINGFITAIKLFQFKCLRWSLNSFEPIRFNFFNLASENLNKILCNHWFDILVKLCMFFFLNCHEMSHKIMICWFLNQLSENSLTYPNSRWQSFLHFCSTSSKKKKQFYVWQVGASWSARVDALTNPLFAIFCLSSVGCSATNCSTLPNRHDDHLPVHGHGYGSAVKYRLCAYLGSFMDGICLYSMEQMPHNDIHIIAA